jgi:2-desacetyl-2-hydroxyethyl bacteriochlorophyllide A dehydrogenase
MQAQSIEITKFGSAQDLEIKNKALKKDLADDEVLVEVNYSGVNFADIVMRLGMYKDAPPKPFTPGYEVSGTVKEIGKNVKRFTVGESVMAGTRFGGYTSHVILPEWQVLKVNSIISLEEAASIPVNFLTAYIALHEFGRIRAGDKVLIDCATGGVGVFALQMIKEAGATAIGLTSSPNKKEFIMDYGAKAYTHKEFESSGEKDFDFILNSRGGASLKTQYNILARSGKLVCIGLQEAINNGKSSLFAKIKAVIQTPWYPMLKLVMQSKSVSGFNALSYFDDDVWMKKHIKMIEDNTFKPHVGGVFKATDVASAHEFLEQRKAKGKVILKWDH